MPVTATPKRYGADMAAVDLSAVWLLVDFGASYFQEGRWGQARALPDDKVFPPTLLEV